MKYDIIATGSNGNAVLINDEILIDCGVPYKKLESYIKKLKLVLLTHIHGDHFNPSTVRLLHRERPALRFGCCEWMVKPLVEAGVGKRVIDVYNPDDSSFCCYEYFDVMAFPLVHDVPNCGYKILDSSLDFLFYATDTGTLEHISAEDYALYLIEANHTKAEIEARAAEKLDRGEFSYERRAASNHLSYEQAMDFLAKNAGPQSRYVLLHQSKHEKVVYEE